MLLAVVPTVRFRVERADGIAGQGVTDRMRLAVASLPNSRHVCAVGRVPFFNRRTFAQSTDRVLFLVPATNHQRMASCSWFPHGRVPFFNRETFAQPDAFRSSIRRRRISSENSFEEIVGKSAALRTVLKEVEIVALTRSRRP